MVVPTHCSPLVSDILLVEAGRQLPLERAEETVSPALSRINGLTAADLFPSARAPIEAHAGLLLWLGDWAQAHEVADIESQDAYYWHAIVHRMEPDSVNAGFWFRKVGTHPIFHQLLDDSNELVADADCNWSLPRAWDPFLFIRWFEEARRRPDSDRAKLVQRIQQAEWELLFSWCTQAA